MISRSFSAQFFALGLAVAAGPAFAATGAPRLVGRTVPSWADIKPRRTLQAEQPPRHRRSLQRPMNFRISMKTQSVRHITWA
jgi:hypothetical protein